jgi:hypothetical protein
LLIPSLIVEPRHVGLQRVALILPHGRVLNAHQEILADDCASELGENAYSVLNALTGL